MLTSAGRRTSLVAAFQSALWPGTGRVVAADVDHLAPALHHADVAARVPLLADPDYVTALLKLAVYHDTALVIPTIDPELPILARARDEFDEAGIRLMVSSLSLVETLGDKFTAYALFNEHGIPTPTTWLPELTPRVLPDRLFVKPRKGSASQHCYATTPAALAPVLEMVPDPVIQEEVEGPELTIDALLDFDGTPIHYVPRTRLKTLAGESIQGVTIDPGADMLEWIEGILRILGDFGAIGAITLQAFLTEGGPVLTEVNLRFGGGVPLAFAAGGDYPRWILELAQGRPVAPRLREYQRRVFMTRSMVETIVTQPLWH